MRSTGLTSNEIVDFAPAVAQRRRPKSFAFSALSMWSSSASERKRGGQPSRYLNGGANTLMREPQQPGDEQTGGWPRDRLVKMNDRFVERVEAAIAAGKNGGRTTRHRSGRLNAP